MSGKTFKKDKFEEKILHEINQIFRTRLSDTRLKFVSITKVELSSDYSEAKVYWDTFDAGKRGDAKAAITSVSGKVRALLAKNLDVRHTPTLEFSYDSQYESENAITSILNDEQKSGKTY
jgi:ribosome-binding factor A